MKTTNKNTPPEQAPKTRSVMTPDMFLEQQEDAQTEENLTIDDYDALGDINSTNDIKNGDDEQIKYWEAIGQNTPVEGNHDDLTLDYELQVDDDDNDDE
jgi:hypothetical protein